MSCSFVFSYFFLFFYEVGRYDNEAAQIIVSNTNVTKLSNVVDKALNDLLKTCYQEPSTNLLQKHPARFERFELDTKIYNVNYRMSISGRLTYTLYFLKKFIEEANI